MTPAGLGEHSASRMKTHSDPQTPLFLTPSQLAQRWHITPMTLRRWRKAGRIPVHHFGRMVRFSMTDVEKVEAEAKA